MMKNHKISFVGGGNMTRAIAGGLIESGFPAGDILISEPNEAARSTLCELLPGTLISDNNETVSTAADCIVLAVKPQVLARVCREIEKTVQTTGSLIISIAAGVRSDDIDAWLGGGLSVVRVMPNQPALLRLGVSGMYANDRVSSVELDRATEIVAAIGSVVHVSREADIDTITAVSGSGPAYFFVLIDILINTAIELGLDDASAQTLAIETATGAAALAAAEAETMDNLIARVRSPGGTTAAALDCLEADQVRAIFARAVTAARDRAVVLADDAHASQE